MSDAKGAWVPPRSEIEMRQRVLDLLRGSGYEIAKVDSCDPLILTGEEWRLLARICDQWLRGDSNILGDEADARRLAVRIIHGSGGGSGWNWDAIQRAILVRVGATPGIPVGELMDLISPQPKIPRSVAQGVLMHLLYDGTLAMDEERRLTVPASARATDESERD